MPVWYRDLEPLNEPFDIGLDETGSRQQYSFNFLATKRPSATVLQEVIAVLVAAGVGAANVNIFASAKAVIPAGVGPYLSLRLTGGAPPLGTHNAGRAAYRRPGIQGIVTASSSAAAYAMADAAWSALVAVRNQYV